MAPIDSTDRCTVYELRGNDLGRKFFTGLHAECCDAIRTLRAKGWPLERLTIIYDDNGRHASFVL